MIRSKTGAGFQNRGAIFLFGPHPCAGRAISRDFGIGPDGFTLYNHVLVMGGDAAPLIPGLPPYFLEQRGEQAEMGGALDRTSAKAQPLGHGIVVDRGMPAVFLMGKHLKRVAKRTAKGEGGVKAHGFQVSLGQDGDDLGN